MNDRDVYTKETSSAEPPLSDVAIATQPDDAVDVFDEADNLFVTKSNSYLPEEEG